MEDVTNGHPAPQDHPAPLVRAFPLGGELLTAVQTEWDALTAAGERPPPDLPRPWEPATWTSLALQCELFNWLEDVTDWINTECVWDPTDLTPGCWAHHPHLIHELAVIADQRRQATSTELLGEWQRITLPAFQDRMRSRVRRYCDDSHQPSPAEHSRN